MPLMNVQLEGAETAIAKHIKRVFLLLFTAYFNDLIIVQNDYKSNSSYLADFFLFSFLFLAT